MSGEVIPIVSTSGRAYFMQFLFDSSEMIIQYPDGSMYQYQNISPNEAMQMLHASSHGTWVWDHLRVRGTVFGYKKPYQLISSFGKPRVWMRSEASRLRHGEIPPSGEPFPGYHPLYNTGPLPEGAYNPMDPNQ